MSQTISLNGRSTPTTRPSEQAVIFTEDPDELEYYRHEIAESWPNIKREKTSVEILIRLGTVKYMESEDADVIWVDTNGY